jgi:hypothetical protein
MAQKDFIVFLTKEYYTFLLIENYLKANYNMIKLNGHFNQKKQSFMTQSPNLKMNLKDYVNLNFIHS